MELRCFISRCKILELVLLSTLDKTITSVTFNGNKACVGNDISNASVHCRSCLRIVDRRCFISNPADENHLPLFGYISHDLLIAKSSI